MEDVLYTIRRVRDVEVVCLREVDNVKIGGQDIWSVKTEVSGIVYGFDIEGILGMGLLTKSGVTKNLREMILKLEDRTQQRFIRQMLSPLC